MSWDKSVLDIPPIPSNCFKQSVKFELPKDFVAARGGLTRAQAMEEVEQLLSVQLRQRSKANNAQIDPSPAKPRIKFKFAPLQDAELLAEADALDTEREESPPTLDSPSEEADEDEDSDSDTESDRIQQLAQQKYFGADAKTDYYKTYQELHGKTHLFVEKHSPKRLSSSRSCPTTLETMSPPINSPSRRRHIPPLASLSTDERTARSDYPAQSPRVQFLGSCLSKSRPALALVLRKENCLSFDFSHQGLGDDFIIDFAACLPEIPLVEAINVSENRLSDRAVNCLFHALENKPNLAYLNISGNAIGAQSALSLRKYISSTFCTLRELILDDADVDDVECALFMMAFERNKSVEHLSLRSNMIGQQARIHPTSPSKVKPSTPAVQTKGGNLPTGGEAIGAMLNVNLNIHRLDLSWNVVKCHCSTPIANALQLNYHLQELTLSYNSIGDLGALVFGQALRINSTLQKLRLAYNGIGSKGAFGLASGLAANAGLQELTLDGNPIGLDAAKALMRSSCSRPGSSQAGHAFCRLSLVECNLTVAKLTSTSGKPRPGEPEKLLVFNPNSPAGNYSLNLAEPYENMIAHEVFRIASTNAEYHFTKLEFAAAASTSRSTVVKLEHAKVKEQPKEEVAVPGKLIASRKAKSAVKLLFKKVDADGSGCVDQSELVQAMREHGITISDGDLMRLLNEYDYDGSGSLQIEEFSDLFFRCGFSMIDSDHSGSLDRFEIAKVLHLMGIDDISDQEIIHMIARYDLNNSGEIDEQEFLAFLKVEILGEGPSSGGVADSTPSKLSERWVIRESASGTEWKIGNAGTLVVDLTHDPPAEDDAAWSQQRSRLGRRISDAFVTKLMSNVQGIGPNVTEQSEFLNIVLEESELYFTSQQAHGLLIKQGAMKSQRRRLEGLKRLLPQVATRQDAIALVSQVVDPKMQWLERFALRSRLGRWFPVLLGSLTNAYSFNLGSANDRAALKRLAQLAQDEKIFSKNRSGRKDTSQNGDWENFRNATINGKSVLLTSTFILNSLLGPSAQAATAIGSNAQVVAFHYVSTQRQPRGTQPLSKRRFEQLHRVLESQELGDEIRAFVSKVWSSDATDPDAEESAQSVAKQRARLHWDAVRRSVLRRDTAAGAETNPLLLQLQSSLEQINQKLALLEMLVSDRWLSSFQALELIATFPNALKARARAACALFGRVVDVQNFMQVKVLPTSVCDWTTCD